MRRKPTVFMLFLISAVLAFGCGGESTGPTDPSADPVEGATLSVSTAQSMGRIGVDGLPAAGKRAVPEYRAVLSTDGSEDISLLLDSDPDGWFFRAPLHPVDPNDGGSFQVRITDGETESEDQPLTVEGLPAAPGAFAAVVAKAREYVEQRAGWAGTSVAELKATAVDELDPVLQPLKLAQSYLDSDDDPNDLADLATNADGFLTAEQAELLDRVFGYFDLETLLQMRIDEFGAADGARPVFEAEEGKRRVCINARIRIDTAEELSQRMIQSRVAEIGTDPESDAGEIMAFGATAMTALSVAPGPVGATAGAAGAVLGTVHAAVGFVAGTLPSSFVSIDFDIDKTEFNEDSTEMTQYKNVKVVAASTGWSADRSLANVAINAFGSYLSFADKAKILDSGFLRDASAVGIGAGADSFFGETDIIEFCVNQWTIDISDPDYCTAASLNGNFDINIPFREIKPKEAGNDQVRVAAQAAKFGGREIHEDVNMQVKQIQVLVSPDDITVSELGEDVQITAEIVNADLTTLRWTPDQGSWNDGLLSDETNDGRTRILKTPTNADLYPFLVRIESLTRNGARESGLPARVGFATIRHEDQRRIRIEPQYDCISPGEEKQFTATVTGFEEYTVLWDVVEGYGSIDENGLYQSLSGGTSNAVIEARVEEDENVRDEARIDASTCNCSLVIKITGDSRWEHESSQAAFLVSQFGDFFYQFFLNFDGDGNPNISASIGGIDETPSPQPGDTGSWKASFVYISGDQSWLSIWDDEKIPLPGVSVNITEFTQSTMVGSFTGNAFQLNDEGEISSLVGVDVQFRAGHWDGGRWPCE